MHQSPASSAHLGKKSLYSTTGVHIGVGNWKLLDWKDKVEWRKWREKNHENELTREWLVVFNFQKTAQNSRIRQTYLSSKISNFVLHLSYLVRLVHGVGQVTFGHHFLVLQKNQRNFKWIFHFVKRDFGKPDPTAFDTGNGKRNICGKSGRRNLGKFLPVFPVHSKIKFPGKKHKFSYLIFIIYFNLNLTPE